MRLTPPSPLTPPLPLSPALLLLGSDAKTPQAGGCWDRGATLSIFMPFIFQTSPVLHHVQGFPGRLNHVHTSRSLGVKPVVLKDAPAGTSEDLALIHPSRAASCEGSLQELPSNYIGRTSLMLAPPG